MDGRKEGCKEEIKNARNERNKEIKKVRNEGSKELRK